jgi:hypothetical protein
MPCLDDAHCGVEVAPRRVVAAERDLVGQQRDLLLRAAKELIARKDAHVANQVTFRSDDAAWGDLRTAVRVVEAGHTES